MYADHFIHHLFLYMPSVSVRERDRILMLFIACFQFIPSLPSSMPKPNYMHLRRRSGTTTTTTTKCPRITHCSSRRYTAGYRCSVGRLLAIWIVFMLQKGDAAWRFTASTLSLDELPSDRRSTGCNSYSISCVFAYSQLVDMFVDMLAFAIARI